MIPEDIEERMRLIEEKRKQLRVLNEKMIALSDEIKELVVETKALINKNG